MARIPDDLTLRDRVTAAIRLNRELVEHLEQGFIPKVHSLRRVTRPERAESPQPGDRTVHAAAATVLDSDNFTVGVYQQLTAHCESIHKSVVQLTGGRPASSPGSDES